MDKTTKGLITRQLMTYGAIISVLVILNSYILHINGINEFTNREPSFMQNLRVLILGMGIFFSVKHISEKVLKITISFGQYLLFGTLIGLFFGVIDSFYFVVFIKYIEPNTLEAIIEFTSNQYAMFDFSAEEMTLMTDMMSKPVVLFFTNLFSDILISFIYTLFFAILHVAINSLKKRQ